MNLSDYQKQARLLFGDCPGCDDCDACRIQALIEHVWDSGRRSGAASTIERKQRSFTWKEWEWSDARVNHLVSHAMKVFPDWTFRTHDEAAIFVRTQLEKACEWAESRERVIRAIDWVRFMQRWIRQEADRAHRGTPAKAQADLFNQPSQPQSPASRRTASRQSMYDDLMNENDRNGPH